MAWVSGEEKNEVCSTASDVETKLLLVLVSGFGLILDLGKVCLYALLGSVIQ